MKHSQINLVGITFVVLLGCAPGFEKEPEAISPAQSSIDSQSLQNFVSIKVQASPDPERYVVYFSWPRIEDQKKIRIRLKQTLAEVSPLQTDFNHEVSHNQTLDYTFEILDDAHRVEKSFPKQVKIPRDFVVRPGQSEFLEDQRLNVQRVFLSSETPLTTNGFKIEILAKELISENGIIQSFSDSQKAENDIAGRSAGELTLSVQSARGTLRIFMRGEIGGDGSKGPNYSDRAKQGHPAGQGQQDCWCLGGGCGQFQSDETIYDLSEIILPAKNTCTCKFGTNGGQGAEGTKGHRGFPAQPGGNSGILKVSIQDGREFDLQSYSIPGSAGTPGEGGDGQLGGLGGPGNPGNDPNDCRGFTGLEGPQGPKGDSGETATDGEKGLTCIYIASEGKNDCY